MTGGGMSREPSGTIYFDGVCCLCNRFVRFVLRHDRGHLFRFAPLQGESFRREMGGSGIPAGADSVVVLWQAADGRREIFVRGRAVVQVLRHLPRLRWLAVLLGLLPEGWLDWLYERVAARRYRWFGRMTECPAPVGEEKRYFLD